MKPNQCPTCKSKKIGIFQMMDYPYDEDGHKDYFNGTPVNCYKCEICGKSIWHDGKKWRSGATIVIFGGGG